MKIQFCFIFLFAIIKSSLIGQPQRKLNDKEILSQIIEDHKLMDCLFQNDQENCLKQFDFDQQHLDNVKKVQKFIQEINEKDKSCQEIVDQQNFMNCRRKITFEVSQVESNNQNLQQDTQLIAHIFTGYFNALENLQQKNKETQQKFQNFIQEKKNTQKGETNLQIFIKQNNNDQQEAAAQLINKVNDKKNDAKQIISQVSPKNLNVEMLDHTVQKLNIENTQQNLTNMQTQKIQSDVNNQTETQEDPLVVKGVQNLKMDDINLINKKLQTYESLGKSNDIVNNIFQEVSKKLDELKREEERNKVLNYEKNNINKDLGQDLYSKNLEDSNNKIQKLRQEITDHLIYSKSLMNQRQLDAKIIRQLSSMDQLNSTIIKKEKLQRNLKQKNTKQTKNKFKDQIVLLKQNLKHKEKNKKNLKEALQDQNNILKLQNISRKLLQKNKLENSIERKLSEVEQVYENIQGFEVLENVQQIHSMQQSLTVEEKIKSEILHRIQNLIQWRDISIKKSQDIHSANYDAEKSENFLRKINETYNQQIKYMLNALEVVGQRKYNEQKKRIQKLQERRKKIKANQFLTENYDLSEFKALEQDKNLQELMEQNSTIERQIAKQSSQLQRLRSEFLKNKTEIDLGYLKFQEGLEKNKKQILKKLHKQSAELVNQSTVINMIGLIICILF